MLDAAPELVSVGAFCIGVDKIDRAAASERGIAVFNDPHSNSRSVAELAMGEIILLMRKVQEQHSASFVFSTHDPQLISHADETFVIRDGRLEGRHFREGK